MVDGEEPELPDMDFYVGRDQTQKRLRSFGMLLQNAQSYHIDGATTDSAPSSTRN
ncbi:hypothetical protein HO173_006701 [Letharia columbiana]|uniref:Uncharacterized protein n=1 Tax=Letharia columbiana TaxID=112416 RepID=A0A8H6L4D4_9LECA|nr:uncharacterized protein HO173_006701 [Letharia columbiana]KAF6235074.1 hypothetical protein HO173_006701 [Letharia columbiana]